MALILYKNNIQFGTANRKKSIEHALILYKNNIQCKSIVMLISKLNNLALILYKNNIQYVPSSNEDIATQLALILYKNNIQFEKENEQTGEIMR